MKPCLQCGEPSLDTRCPEHSTEHSTARRDSARARGYDSTWDRLSKRARKLQPFCARCGTPENLTADHKPTAWLRKAQNKPLRLSDVVVLCGPCNTRAGSSRPGSERAEVHGGDPAEGALGPRGKASGRMDTPGGIR